MSPLQGGVVFERVSAQWDFAVWCSMKLSLGMSYQSETSPRSSAMDVRPKVKKNQIHKKHSRRFSAAYTNLTCCLSSVSHSLSHLCRPCSQFPSVSLVCPIPEVFFARVGLVSLLCLVCCEVFLWDPSGCLSCLFASVHCSVTTRMQVFLPHLLSTDSTPHRTLLFRFSFLVFQCFLMNFVSIVDVFYSFTGFLLFTLLFSLFLSSVFSLSLFLRLRYCNANLPCFQHVSILHDEFVPLILDFVGAVSSIDVVR